MSFTRLEVGVALLVLALVAAAFLTQSATLKFLAALGAAFGAALVIARALQNS